MSSNVEQGTVIETVNEGGDEKRRTQIAGTSRPKRIKKAAFLSSMNENEKEVNRKIIENMNKRINYLRNPRFKKDKAPILINTKEVGSIRDQGCPFTIEPRKIKFVDFNPDCVYEIPLKVTNKSGVSRGIKHIPPKSESPNANNPFSISKITFPSPNTPLIAPGMSIIFYIQFDSSTSPPNPLANMTIITEENAFKVQIKAKRNHPKIDLVNPMEATPCWVGDKTEKMISFTNSGGEGGFKFFCERDEDDEKQEGEVIRIGPFIVTPTEFYLGKDNTWDLWLMYQPERAGIHEETLILAGDNEEFTRYTVRGEACMLDLEVISMDNRRLDFKSNPLQTILFPTTMPNSEHMRRIAIKNNSPRKVQFHWSLYRSKHPTKISILEEEIHYSIEPLGGSFAAGEEKEFKFTFKPIHAESYYEFADLIVEDVPIQCVDNAPEPLKGLLAPKLPGPTYLGSNTRHPSIPFFKFNLQGHGNRCQIDLSPELIIFDTDLLIGKTHKADITLFNKTSGFLTYDLRLHAKTAEDFQVVLENDRLQSKDNISYTGSISEENEEISLYIDSLVIGKHTAYFTGNVKDGIAFSFMVTANFVGPTVKLIENTIDFKLLRINSKSEYRLNFENTSSIEAEVLFKNVKNRKIDFGTHPDIEGTVTPAPESIQRSISQASVAQKSIISILPSAYKKLGKFEKGSFLIQIHTSEPETVEEFYQLVVKNGDTQYLKLFAEIQKPHVKLNRHVLDLGKTYVGRKYDVDKSHPSSLILVNYGNQEAQFQWEEKVIPDLIHATFNPARGVIPAKSRLQIDVNVTFFAGGKFSELFACDISETDGPLGFFLETDVHGLTVTYHSGEQASIIQASEESGRGSMQSTLKSLLPGSLYEQHDREKFSSSVLKDIAPSFDPHKNILKDLNFSDGLVNRSGSRKFIIKNHSGIAAHYELQVKDYEPILFQDPGEGENKDTAESLATTHRKTRRGSAARSAAYTSEEDMSEGDSASVATFKTKTSKRVGFSITKRGKKLRPRRLKKPIISDAHEETHKFASKAGETFAATRKMEREQNFYLRNNKGIALVCIPHKGELAPNSETIVTVGMYNNVCGKFEDTILCKVKGLGVHEIPVSLTIKGSPIIIPKNQIGLQYRQDPPTLCVPPVLQNSPTMTKTFKIHNTGIRDVSLEWKMYDLKAADSGKNYFSLNIGKHEGNARDPYKIELEAIEPETESLNCAFAVTPKEAVVHAKKTHSFEINFQTIGNLGGYDSVILAHPVIIPSSDDESGGVVSEQNLGEISLCLHAELVQPVITFDKKLRKTGRHLTKFEARSFVDEAPNLIKKIMMTNETAADLTFNISISGGFQIVSTKSNGTPHPLVKSEMASSKSKKVSKIKGKGAVVTMFQLAPLKIVECMVKYNRPDPLDGIKWPLLEIFNEKGELLITYSNGCTQIMDLEAFLYRPRIILHTERDIKNEVFDRELDFGTVFIDGVGIAQQKIFITNRTQVIAKWQLNYIKYPVKGAIGAKTITNLERENILKIDDPDVFEFQITEGTLKGPSIPMKLTPNGPALPSIDREEADYAKMPQKILINFRPKRDVLYKSKFKFVTEGGIGFDLILKGKGELKEDLQLIICLRTYKYRLNQN